MKKALLALSLIATTLGSFAQDKSKMRPYVGAGAGLSGGIATYGGEVGCWNDKIWVAVVYENTPDAVAPNHVSYIGPKFYRKLSHFGKSTDVFAYGAVKVGIDNKSLPLVFEPGLAAVFNFTDNLALQWSFSSPIYENTTVFAPTYLSSSLGLCWFF